MLDYAPETQVEYLERSTAEVRTECAPACEGGVMLNALPALAWNESYARLELDWGAGLVEVVVRVSDDTAYSSDPDSDGVPAWMLNSIVSVTMEDDEGNISLSIAGDDIAILSTDGFDVAGFITAYVENLENYDEVYGGLFVPDARASTAQLMAAE